MFKRLLVIIGFVLAMAPVAAWAEDAAPTPAAAAPAAAAPAAAPATPAEMEKRIADLEAYVNNGARVDGPTSKIGVRPRCARIRGCVNEPE